MNRISRQITVFFASFLLLSGVSAYSRDWNAFPASVEIPRAERVVAIGDIHGAFEQFLNSLVCLGLVEPVGTNTFNLTWTGGKTVLVFTGDYGDRGEYSKEVMDAVIDLQAQAEKAGGKVIALLGNHEIMLIDETVETRAYDRGYQDNRIALNTIWSFERAGLNFYDAIGRKGKYGRWIRDLPLFAVINGFLFIHAGPPYPYVDRAKLCRQYKNAMQRERYSDPKGILKFPFGPQYIRGWWELTDHNIAHDSDMAVKACAKLGVDGIVAGHTPGAMGTLGFVNSMMDRFVNIDLGMTRYYRASEGGGLLIELKDNGKMVFTGVYPDKPRHKLFERDFSGPTN